jgi:hypothetical protein
VHGLCAGCAPQMCVHSADPLRRFTTQIGPLRNSDPRSREGMPHHQPPSATRYFLHAPGLGRSVQRARRHPATPPAVQQACASGVRRRCACADAGVVDRVHSVRHKQRVTGFTTLPSPSGAGFLASQCRFIASLHACSQSNKFTLMHTSP